MLAQSTAPEISLFDLHPTPTDFLTQVIRGLSREQKRLPSMYFYDERGSQLFDRICELQEYYPTRTEVGILDRNASEMSEAMGSEVMLIELGSGSSTKTHILLRALRQMHSYVPIDISKEHLLNAAQRIDAAFPSLAVTPVCADFMGELRLPEPDYAAKSKYVLFPGSTIGNFSQEERSALLRRIQGLCKPEGGGLLLGIDLKKDVDRLKRAYDDARGVTARFNLNLLRRINRELHGNFNLDLFRHESRYDEVHGRVEMHLVSDRPQSVRVGDTLIRFAAGESICTEHSYKFSVAEFATLGSECGLDLTHTWTDPEELFAVLLLRAV